MNWTLWSETLCPPVYLCFSAILLYLPFHKFWDKWVWNFGDLAHWWAYSIGRSLLSVNIFKHLLWNHGANLSKISYGAPMGWRNENSFDWSRWHDQNVILKNQWAHCLETWYVALAPQVLQNSVKLWPYIDLDPIFQGQIWTLRL